MLADQKLQAWPLPVILSFFDRHSADKKIFKIASLNTEIKALKSDFIEAKKQLLILKKESTITHVLAAQGVGPASQPPIKITLVNE